MEKAFYEVAQVEAENANLPPEKQKPVDYGSLDLLRFAKNYDGPASFEGEEGQIILRISCALAARDEKIPDLSKYGVDDPNGLKARRVIELLKVSK